MSTTPARGDTARTEALAALATVDHPVDEWDALRALALACEHQGDATGAALVRLLIGTDPAGTGAALLAAAGPIGPGLVAMFTSAPGPLDRGRAALALHQCLEPVLTAKTDTATTVLRALAIAYFHAAGWTRQDIDVLLAAAEHSRNGGRW